MTDRHDTRPPTPDHPQPDRQPSAVTDDTETAATAGTVDADLAGDGQPPVPITVWLVPAARDGETLSIPLAQRLLASFTRAGQLVVDLTDGDQLAQAASAARRRHRRPHRLAIVPAHTAALIVAEPRRSHRTLFTSATRALTDGGCLAVIVTSPDPTVQPALVVAARAAGLTYLQHYIATHHLTEPVPATSDTTTPSPSPAIHADVVVFRRPARRP